MVFFIKCLLFYVILIGIASYLSLLERKIIGRVQLRYGPRYCGKCGILQPIADGLKLFFKQGKYSAISTFACGLLLFASLLQFAYLPLGNFTLLHSQYSLLFIVAIHALINFAELIIGISSNSKYGLIGGTRAIYQKLGSDICLILVILCIYEHTKSFDLNVIATHLIGIMLILLPILFILMLINTNRIPFDFLEAESDLVAGAYTEYGGILFGIIYLSEYLNILFSCCLISVLFLPGFAFLCGVIINFLLIVFIRCLFPRNLQIQMIKIMWRVFIPTTCIIAIVIK